jgi:hypothetical protein
MLASPLRPLALAHRPFFAPLVAAVVASGVLASGAVRAQDGQDPPLPPSVIPGERDAQSGVWLASDGEPAAAGRIPNGTSDAARERFGKLAGRLTAKNDVRSFVLRFDLEMRTDNGTQEARRTEFRYLDEGPGWVFGAFLNDDGSVKQCQMRGPRGENGGRGYWQVLKDGTEVDLRGGDDFSESRAELDGWAALCHDLLLLQQPTRLRLVRLAAREARPAAAAGVGARALVFGDGDVVVLPDVDVALVGSTQKLAERALGLEWLEVVTPDIRLWRDGAGLEAVRRVLLGIDASTGVPELAVLTQRVEGRIVDAESTLLHLADWRPLDGRHSRGDRESRGDRTGGEGTSGGSWLPHSTRLFELREAEGPERELAPVVFKNRARLDLFLLAGGVIGGPPPKASTFRPPSMAVQDPPR